MLDFNTPEWVKDATFYQIFPDRFAKSSRVKKPNHLEPWDSLATVHGYKGGDLYGVIEKLDYLTDLGVTALYFTPVFQSGSNHRYHTHDYYRVDPMLGGNEALRALLDACHERGMRVVLDGVFNHASRGFFQFHDILENGEGSAYLDWFHIRKFPLHPYNKTGDIGYEAWWNLPALPKFNTRTPAVREFLWNVGTHWLEFGIDGWRLDVPNEINDDSFWQEFRRRCRAINPDCYIVGEIWGEAYRWLQGDQFDAVMNYPFTRAVFGFFGAGSLNYNEIARCGYGRIPVLAEADTFAATIHNLLDTYRKEVTEVQLNLLGSHDTPRALTILDNDEAAFRMALLFQMIYPGAPCIYYGDELGMCGGHDPHCRHTMPWERPSEWKHDLRDYVRQLLKLRNAHAPMRRGRFSTVYASGNLYVCARTCSEGSFMAAFNVSRHEMPVDVPVLPGHTAREGRYHAPLSGLEAELKDGHLRVEMLPPRAGVLFQYL